MRQHGENQSLDVVRYAVVTTLVISQCLRGAPQRDGASRAHTDRQKLRVPRRFHDCHNVVQQRIVDPDLGHGHLRFKDVFHPQNGFHALHTGPMILRAQDFLLCLPLGISHANAEQKAIELRFGKRVGAVVLDGVLRGDHHERTR